MENQIDNDLKLALKSGDKFTLSVLRMLKSEIINESRKGSLHTLTDDEVLKVIKKGVKTRKDSIEEYKKYGKLDTVNELAKEVDILNKYLPQEMSEEEIIKIVNEVFDEFKPSSMKDMGNLMKVISSKITNADMSLVSSIIKDKLKVALREKHKKKKNVVDETEKAIIQETVLQLKRQKIHLEQMIANLEETIND